MKCPLSVPWNLPFPSMTVSTICHENTIPWDRSPCAALPANRCVHVPQLGKSRPPLGTELQQLHICRGEKLSAKTRGGSHPPPPACRASSAFVPLQMTPRWVDLITHTCMTIHNASKIPGQWLHLTWTAHSNRAYQQEALQGKKRKSMFKGAANIKWFCRIQWASKRPLVMRRTPKHMLDFKSVLRAYHCLQSDCVKFSSKLPRAGMMHWVDRSLCLTYMSA